MQELHLGTDAKAPIWDGVSVITPKYTYAQGINGIVITINFK